MVKLGLKTGALLSYAAVAFNAIAGLLYTPWMIDCIGNENYALYTLVLSIINFLVLDFGLSDTTSRYLSKYYTEGKYDEANRFLGIVYRLYFLIAAVLFLVFLIVFFNVETIYSSLTLEQLNVFKGLFVVMAFYSVVSFPFITLNGVLLASEKYVALNACGLAQKVLTVALIVAALLMDWGVFSLVLVNAFVGLLFVAIKLVVVSKATVAKPTFSYFDSKEAKSIVGFSAWAMVSQVCQRVIFNIVPSIIAILSSTWEVTLFGLAASLELYVWTVANALGSIFVPRISQIVAGEGSVGNKMDRLQTYSEKIGRIQLLAVGFIFTAFLVVGDEFVDCWMGNGYHQLYPCVLVLLISGVIEYPKLLANTSMLVLGNVRRRGICFLIGSLCSLVLVCAGSRYFGALGCCVAISVGCVVRSVLMDFSYRELLRFKMIRMYVNIYGRWIIAAFVSCIVGFGLRSQIPGSSWVHLLIIVCCFAIVYLLFAYGCMLSKNEKNEVASRLRRR